MTRTAETMEIWNTLDTVLDPEVPALSVTDLGIIRDVKLSDGGKVVIDVTPTYSGCPATDLISEIIKAAVVSSGHEDVTIKTVLSPTWTTDWITEDGRKKLKEYGIAPPVGEAATGKAALLGISPVVHCPRCDSTQTEQVSEFGSTACKAMYRCTSCLEPFEYFKCI
ncbi:phenylacetate-CoA oxygenase subunit PaaJ [Kordiimonas sediminis]|uniref:Phenylacetate-CoA oxygenase subunit PaaJ n=1 Tax=Kordiimonas sediminis TaxID=1735581 RepID=A0A919E441_9PROT|nr:1,2-phenylacetyl-CoA epoxidase subunit PaaD [Kordiimonas sediminis]GHF11014.1 phenylacetate-CoA oxygenase subunit PaaJ [Kordiimonas sediminis]